MDRDVLILGSVANDMTSSFEAYWAFDLSVLSTDMLDVRKAIDGQTVVTPSIARNYAVPLFFKPSVRARMMLSV